MGFFSTLLSIGTCVGKVCQVVASSMSTVVEDEETGAALSSSALNYDNMMIGMYQGDTSEKLALHALNISSETKMIQMPPDDNDCSIMYRIPAGCKKNIEREVSRVTDPDDEMQISTVDEDASVSGGTGGVAAKFRIKNLVYGKTDRSIDVYGYRFSTDADGLWVKDGNFAKLTFCGLDTQTGLRMTLTQSMQADKTTDDGSYFGLDLSKCGFREGDIMSGVLEFSVASDAWKKHTERMQEAQKADGMSEPEPLTDADLRLIRKMGIEPECAG